MAVLAEGISVIVRRDAIERDASDVIGSDCR
jgi:hypothetical protein